MRVSGRMLLMAGLAWLAGLPAIATPLLELVDGSDAGVQTGRSYRLRIEQEVIQREDYAESAELELSGRLGGQGPIVLRLRAGAAVQARNVEILLRNVHGEAYFKADFEALRRLLEGRPVTLPPDPKPP